MKNAEIANDENRDDLAAAIAKIKALLDGVIEEGAEGSKWNPFD